MPHITLNPAAEALEVLLTGNLRRWEKLSAVWRQGSRSGALRALDVLHAGDPESLRPGSHRGCPAG